MYSKIMLNQFINNLVTDELLLDIAKALFNKNNAFIFFSLSFGSLFVYESFSPTINISTDSVDVYVCTIYAHDFYYVDSLQAILTLSKDPSITKILDGLAVVGVLINGEP